MSTVKRIAQALALTGAGIALSTTTGATAVHAAPAAGRGVSAAAAQCVNLTGYRDWDGLYHYAEVKNICSGTYRFRIKRSDDVNIGCYTIQGGVWAYYVYANSLDFVTPTGIKYC
jgi:hypothetical protein